jgi:transporter family-2 protein
MTTWFFLAIAFGVGALITVQIGTNTRLKEAFGEAVPAVIVSSLLGVVILAIVTLGVRTPWPSAARIAGAPWWAWLGGLLGAVYAVATVLLARRLGAAPLAAVVVTGQLVCSVVLDHFGVLGFTEHGLSVGRVAGCLLMIAGFILISRF